MSEDGNNVIPLLEEQLKKEQIILFNQKDELKIIEYLNKKPYRHSTNLVQHYVQIKLLYYYYTTSNQNKKLVQYTQKLIQNANFLNTIFSYFIDLFQRNQTSF